MRQKPVKNPVGMQSVPPGLTQYQKFRYEEVDRAVIQNAAYNPRRISDVAKKRLRESLETQGLVETLVWNRRTGNLVAGHQRLSILDQLEGSPHFKIGVAVIDVDLKTEMALNVRLNNPSTQGMFDPDLMLDMLQLPDAPTLAEMGFTRSELELEIGALPELDDLLPVHAKGGAKDQQAASSGEASDIQAVKDAQRQAKQETREAQKAGQPARETADETNDRLRQKKQDYRQRTGERPQEDATYFLVVRFNSTHDKIEFLNHCGLPVDMQHLDADLLKELLAPKYANWPRVGVDGKDIGQAAPVRAATGATGEIEEDIEEDVDAEIED